MMNRYYVDLHIHIGRTRKGRAVKITGAKSLTLSNIMETAVYRKGLNMLGIIDCHSPEVLEELEELVQMGVMEEKEGGGIAFQTMTLIPGSELEIYDDSCQGPVHVLCFFPTLEKMRSFSIWLSQHLKNIHLSSQRIYASGRELQKVTKDLGGLFIPAHVFTPFKSLYGKGVKKSLTEIFDPTQIDAIELGLSADTYMADQLSELHGYPFITNSDAHSLPKLAREYQLLEMKEASFSELQKALKGEDGRQIVANFGLDPLLGKYHQSTCAKCIHPLKESEKECPECGHKQKVKGVSDRIMELSDGKQRNVKRPPYIHQVPLEFIPGLGPKRLESLLDHFGTEMDILHEVSKEAMLTVVPEAIADAIINAREGRLKIESGGGGRYGKVQS